MSISIHRRLPPTVISAALLIFAGVWFVSARIFHVANLHSKDGVFGAPVWSLGILFLVPLTSLVLGPCLVHERRTAWGKLHLVDYAALVAALAPFLFVAGLCVTALLRHG
jgi:hypothetical protein